MKALVTGGAGFIGSNIVKKLYERNYEIIVYDNLSTGYKKNLKPFPTVKFIEGDVRDFAKLKNTMQGCKIVFHLAANIGNVKSIEDPVVDSEINVIGTLNVINAAHQQGVNKIVYSSSAAIFGEPQYQPIDEKHPIGPDSPYGVSKLAGEKHCLCYSKIYDIDIVCLRYFNVYGINQRYDAYGNVIPIFVTLILQNKEITIFGDGEQTRDFIHVNDVAMANILSAEKEGLNGAFNIGSGESITINSLTDILQDVHGNEIKILYADERKGEVKHSIADISLAQTVFDYNPSTDLIRNLHEYYHWLKNEDNSK